MDFRAALSTGPAAMKAHFEMMAAYNAWANERLYAAAAELADADLRRDLGAAFGSVLGTLNHLFVADVIWMSRFRGQPNPPWALDHIAHERLPDLRARRRALDRDIQGFVASLAEADLAGDVRYTTISNPARVTQRLDHALAHVFNHQTHHRGQCHALLTRLTGRAPALDLLFYQRELAGSAAPDAPMPAPARREA